MRCIKCNKEIRADIKFCPYCGQLVKKLPPIPKTDVTHTTKEKNEKPKTDLNTEKLESIECFLIALEDVIQYKRNHIKHEEKVTEKQTDSTTEQLSEYEKRLIENSSHEENIDKWKIYIILGITLFLFVKAGISIELSFELLIMTMIVGTIIEVLLIPFFNAYKKNWGCYKAKEKLGLLPTPPSAQPLPFEYYRTELDKILDNIKSHTDRKYISWGDIESEINNPKHLEHKTLTKSFKREGIDIFAYIKSKGFMMNPSSFSFHYTFDDGECVVSSMEYEFSSYLRSLGFEYKKCYYRNVLYKTFSDEQSKMNCDYKIMIDGIPLYVEIAGIIYNCKDDTWREHKFASKKENEYRDKMIKKEKRLIESGQHFLFLFKTEMFNDEYKTILQNEINRIRQEAA